ncbi:MAG TPA: DUF4440 domain-containing protein [Pyrinomonadaceae bacterium]|nr:DUF4440 domain-containing protein [Pyrinomonadaceae bacterium]
MKRCPTCKRSFEDDSLSYCLDDGTPLTAEAPSQSGLQETIVTSGPPAVNNELPATQYAQLPGKATVSASGLDIPNLPSYSPAPPPRRTWPWVVGGLTILLLIGIVIAAVIAIPMIMKNSNNSNSRVVVDDSPAASPSESATSTSKDNAAPTDEDVVLKQLTDLEKQWTEANIKGDKEALGKILAAEYSGGDPRRGKQEYIDELTHDPEVNSWELLDLKATLEGDRATMSGYLKQETTRGTEVYGFTDEFIWRDGRWQAVASRSSRVK